MPQTALSPPIAKLHPIVPVEVMDMILAAVQSNLVLAICCRVNKHFRERCQPALYRHLQISCDSPSIEPDDYIPGYVLSQGTKLLFRTLEENKDLRQYPRKLTLDAGGDAEQEWVVDDEEGDSDVEEGDESRGHYEFTSEFEDPSEPFERCLRLLPKIDSVCLDSLAWWWRPVRDVLFDNGERWKEITVDGELLREEDDQRDFRQLRILEVLDCTSLRPSRLPDQYLPRSLKTLITRIYEPPVGDPSTDYQLQTLRAILSAETIIRVPVYRQLHHLHLVQHFGDFEPLSPEALLAFQSLPNLGFLSIDLDERDPDYFSAVTSLLQYLPASLSRLDFPNIIPFDILNPFITSRSNRAPLILGLRADRARKEGLQAELESVRTACEEAGIKLEYTERWDHWRKFLTSLPPSPFRLTE